VKHHESNARVIWLLSLPSLDSISSLWDPLGDVSPFSSEGKRFGGGDLKMSEEAGGVCGQRSVRLRPVRAASEQAATTSAPDHVTLLVSLRGEEQEC
jgi:hypothetical protein